MQYGWPDVEDCSAKNWIRTNHPGLLLLSVGKKRGKNREKALYGMIQNILM